MSIRTLLFKPKSTEPDDNREKHTQENSVQKRRNIPYVLPKNYQEISRLDFQHYALSQYFHANFLAPISPLTVKHMLDVGCGTGRWVLEMGKEFQSARIIGIDIDPPNHTAPEQTNCLFTQADILRGLPFPSNSFDYTHQRFLAGAIPAARWPFIISELGRITASNGWVECFEAGNTYHNPGPATEQLLDWWHTIEEKLEFNLSFIPHMDELFRAYGLVHVTLKAHSLPLDKKERVGDLLSTDLESVFRSMKSLYQKHIHMSSRRYDELVNTLRAEWSIYHTHYEFYSIVGQKPVMSEVI